MLELWPIFLRVAAIRFLILSKSRPFSLPIQSWFKLPDYTLVEEKLGGTGYWGPASWGCPKTSAGIWNLLRGFQSFQAEFWPTSLGGRERMPQGNKYGPCWDSSWTPQGHLRTTLGWMGPTRQGMPQADFGWPSNSDCWKKYMTWKRCHCMMYV